LVLGIDQDRRLQLREPPPDLQKRILAIGAPSSLEPQYFEVRSNIKKMRYEATGEREEGFEKVVNVDAAEIKEGRDGYGDRSRGGEEAVR
jgi:hypothetical protein